MANWTQLTSTITDNIKKNSQQDITGDVLQAVLKDMVSALGATSGFKGIAVPAISPLPIDGTAFYIATEAGVYANLGGTTITTEGIYIFEYMDASWTCYTLYVKGISAELVTVEPAGGIVATNVQAALEEIDGEVSELELKLKGKPLPLDVTGSYVNLINKNVGDTLTVTTLNSTFYGYLYRRVFATQRYIIKIPSGGTVSARCYALVNDSFVIKSIAGTGSSCDVELLVEEDGYLIVNSITDIEYSITPYLGNIGYDNEANINELCYEKIAISQTDSYIPIDYSIGDIANCSMAINSGYGYIKRRVKKGEQYYIYISGGATNFARFYALLDNNYIVKNISGYTGTCDVNLTVAYDGYLIINVSSIANYIITQTVLNSVKNNTLNIEDTKNELFNKIPILRKDKFINLNFSVGNTLTISISHGDKFGYYIAKVAAGERFYLKVKPGSIYARAYCILDKDMKILVVSAPTEGIDREVTINVDGYLVVNVDTTTDYQFSKYYGNIYKKLDGVSYTPISGGYYNLMNKNIGGFLAENILPFSTFCYLILQVYSGETYEIKTTGNTVSAKSYALIDNNRIIQDIQQTSSTYLINVTKNGYLIINSLIADYSIKKVSGWVDRLVDLLFLQNNTDIIKKLIYEISNYNNSFDFDSVKIGDAKISMLKLEVNKNVPIIGQCISTDIFNNVALTDPTAEQLQKLYVPYLYSDQQKIGTMVLYDAENGNPFIFDKDGNKTMLQTL